ncbi:hypothetical protein [Roseateles oligotrophus]|uniref:Uncharacterized protein n=1 Tax=Roseateles oligotrophus TaxID=1769250 RepID=A0ABT2YF28_9BURK|nr:hypothetical protein [Roseateles oligotrophus]MCV2368655.1 hypothetical protein [Roseateles oligotrophus]
MRKLLLTSLLCSSAALAQVSGPLVSPPAFSGMSEPLEHIALRARTSAFAVREFRPSRNHDVDKAQTVAGMGRAMLAPLVATPVSAPYMQTATYQPLGATMGANFEALGLGTPGFGISGAPPDTTLAVSPTQIVQWVNSQFAVYNKAGVPQLPAPGFLNGNTIWAALGASSLCATTNRGDPIVQYDRMAQRWVLTQFAFNASFTQNSQCIAVSQTSNAMGAYHLYEYSFGAQLPDYGKIGVWPDAYYITYNMFTNGASFAGGRACAYDRAKMLAGVPAPSQICFNSLSRFSFLPSDLDGPNLPPAGTPNIHISWDWAFLTTAPYTMQLTKFVPDFANPAASTFSDGFGGAPFSFVAVPMDAGTFAACNDNGNACVPQLGTTQKLDTLGSRQMYRLVYRNFGTYDALLVTQAVDTVAANTANLRWWEIRNPAANPPVVYQNSTFAPNGDARWMSSAAFDKLGNIGVGYSVSSATMNPGIMVTGRRRADPKNLLRAEVLVQAGGGSQTTGLSRWGDYSTMQIDPADECTFWYTTQYIGANGTFNWRTKIASFKFPNCL